MSVVSRAPVACFLFLFTIAGCSGPPSPDRIESSSDETIGPALPFEPCARLAIGENATALRNFQRDLQELVLATGEGTEALATLGMQFQLARIDRSEARLRYLLENDPSRIRVDDGPDGLWEFEWKDADTEALLVSDPEFARTREKIESLGQQYEAQPGRAEFAEKFRNELALTREYEQIFDKLDEGKAGVDRTLKRCEPLEGG